MIEYVVSAIIGILAGIVLGIWLWKEYLKPIEIKYKVSSKEWIFPNLVTFVVLLFCIVMEMAFGGWVSGIETDNNVCWTIIQIFNNGVLVIPVILFTSWIYSIMIKSRGLDYSVAYDENLKKVYFTMACSVVCLFLIIVIWEPWHSDAYEETGIFINRIVMWIMNTICIWVGFGMFGKGRIIIEVDKVREKELSLGDKIKLYKEYYVYFFLTGGIALILLIVFALNEGLHNFIIVLGVAFIIPLVIWSIVLKNSYCPAEKRSKKRLIRNYKKVIKEEYGLVYGRYKRERYALIKERSEIKLIILGESIKWEKANEEKKEEMKNLFKQIYIEFKIDKNDNELCNNIQKEVEKLSNERDKFVADAFDDAKKSWEKEQVEEVTKRNEAKGE